MAYTLILKALHRDLQQTATRYAVQTCKPTQVSFIHTHRTVPAASRLTFLRRVEVPSPVVPALSCFIQAQSRRRRLSLDFTARNKRSPEERDKSVSRYQSVSPKPSAAQKGKQRTKILLTGALEIVNSFSKRT